MNEFLQPADFIDSGHDAVVAFAGKHMKGNDPREKAVSLYYAVRDEIRYNPFLDCSTDAIFRASDVLAAGEGFCIGKAALLAAVARVAGVPARVGFADVRNHLTSPRLAELVGGDVYVYHGYTELQIGGRWVKATPAFNVQLCRRFRVKPLEFDGREDSIFHPFDQDERRHMEYLRERGTYGDVPVAEIQAAFRVAHPRWFDLGRAAARETFTPG
jgi:transglutaminase-like putative cysteine protease